MTTLSTFVLVGTILSYDNFLATVEFSLNPMTNAGPSLAVVPLHAIPCKIEVGKQIYVVKHIRQEAAVITCEKEN